MCQAGRRRVRSKYCAAWAASHKHQGYSTCYGTALACQQHLDSPPPVQSPAQLLFRFCNRKGEIFLTSRTEYVAQIGKWAFLLYVPFCSFWHIICRTARV